MSKTATLGVNELVSVTAWTSSPPGQLLQAVQTENGLAGYIANTGADNLITYGFADVPESAVSVTAVRVTFKATASGNPNKIGAALTIGGGTLQRQETPTLSVYPTMSWYTLEWTGNWTAAQANAMTCSFDAICQEATNNFIDIIMAEADYDEVGGTIRRFMGSDEVL